MIVGAPTYYPAGPIQIRDGTFDRVKVMTGFANVFKQRVLPTKDDQLPLACVWHGGDRTEPWGDANVGPPSFDHTLAIVVDIMTKAASQNALDAPIVDLVERLRATLLTDPTWVNLFEACSRCDVAYTYPGEGNFFYAKGTVTFELTFRSEWEPVIQTDFTEMDTTYPPTGLLQTIDLQGNS